MGISSRWFSVVFVVVFSSALADEARDPELVVHWKMAPVPLGQAVGAQTYPTPPPMPLGFLGLELVGQAPNGSWSITDIRLVGNRITVGNATATYRFQNLILRNVLVTTEPVREMRNHGGLLIPVNTDRSHTVRRETTLRTHPNLGVTVRPKAGQTFPALTLPTTFPLELVPDSARRELKVAIRDPRAVRERMHEAVNTSFTNDALKAALDFIPENVPSVSGIAIIPQGIIDDVNRKIREEVDKKIEEGKPRLFQVFRDSLHREIDRPQFIDRVAEALNRGLPLIPADDVTRRLRTDLTLATTPAGLTKIAVGGTDASPPASPVPDAATTSLAVYANESGLNLATQAYLARIPGARQQRRFFTPPASELRQWAEVLSDVARARIEPDNVRALALEFPRGSATRFTFSGSDESPRLTLVTPLTIYFRAQGDRPLDAPLAFTFRVTDERLALQSIRRDPPGPPRSMTTTFQYDLLTILAARQLERLPARYAVRLTGSTIFITVP